jgi:hypothetical protein
MVQADSRPAAKPNPADDLLRALVRLLARQAARDFIRQSPTSNPATDVARKPDGGAQ